MDHDRDALRSLLRVPPGASLEEAARRFLRDHEISLPEEGADPRDPLVSAYFLLTMAGESVSPREVDDTFRERFDAWMARRPATDDTLGQLPIDAASCLARAEIIASSGARSALAVGDDDAVSLALLHLGVTEVAVADLDERLLAALRDLSGGAIETHVADFFHSAVPEPLRRRFDAVVTDPFRDLDGGVGFLCFAAACVREGGSLYWVDHPAWNFEHARVRETMATLGWDVVETHERVHRYALSLSDDEIRRVASGAGLDAEWLLELVEHTAAVSNLYRLERRAR